MNILFLINYPGKGGTEKYIKILAEMLIKKGDRVFLAYNENGPLINEMAEIADKIFQIKMDSPYDFKASKSLANICNENNIDIVHTQFARENYIAIFSKNYKNKAEIIHTSHINLSNNIVWKTANKFLMKRNSAIIAVCNSVKDHLINNNYPSEKINVIHNGIEYMPLNEKSKLVKEEFNINEFLFVTLTRFTKEKGTLFLLKSALKLEEITEKRFKVLLAGDGELLEEAKAYVKENYMEDYIIFAGYRTDSDDILEAGDCFINSSESEASSFAVFEAMGKALPIIATNVGGNPDIINKETNCGTIVEYNNVLDMAKAMKEVLENEEKAKVYGENSLKAVRDIFNIELSLDKTYELYKNAIVKI